MNGNLLLVTSTMKGMNAMNIRTSNAKKKILSNLDMLHLHAELNQHLEKFHDHLKKMKQRSFVEHCHLEDEKQRIVEKIKEINTRIHHMTTLKRQEREYVS